MVEEVQNGTVSLSQPRVTFTDLPAEVLSYIVRLIYLESIPRSHHRNLDLHGLPSTYSDGRNISSPHSAVQSTLWSLCLTSKTLFAHARPLLYRRINATLPNSFILLIRTLGAAALATAYERFQVTGKLNQDPNDPESFTSIVAAAGFARVLGTNLRISDHSAPAGSANSTPTASAPSSSIRSRSQQRRIISQTGSNDQAEEDELDLVWRPDPFADPNAPATQWTVSLHPLGGDTDALQRCIRVVDFSQFRTQGMRRTIGDGLERRFVTPPRLLALLTSAPDLVAFGASQTMDSSLSVEVLEALLFRGGKITRPARLRGVSVERRRREEQLSLLALDFTDCVSPVFEKAVEEFVNRHLKKFSGRRTDTVREEEEHGHSSTAEQSTESDTDDHDAMSTSEDEEETRGRGRAGRGSELTDSRMTSNDSRSMTRTRSMSMHLRDSEQPHTHPAKATRFSSIQRLSMSGIMWRLELLAPFVQAFTRLTHLDLSRTRVDGELLSQLSASPTIHLESLSLAHCRSLTSESITDLLVDSPVTSALVELSLEGTLLFPTNIDRPDLKTIITTAPCFRSGQMRYLDMGGCGMDDELLGLLRPLPKLLDLGLGASDRLTLSGVSQFLRDSAPNVQILELSDSCYDPSRNSGVSALELSTNLIQPCCTTPPLPLSLQLAALGFAPTSDTPQHPSQAEIPRAPTNLRVIGLNGPSLRSIRDGIGAWKVIWGSGKRGWVVDTSAGPYPEARDDLDQDSQETAVDIDDVDMAEGIDEDDTRGRDHTVVNRTLAHVASPLARQRSLRSGYEPETPPLSRHASLSPSRARSVSRRRNPNPSFGLESTSGAASQLSRGSMPGFPRAPSYRVAHLRSRSRSIAPLNESMAQRDTSTSRFSRQDSSKSPLDERASDGERIAIEPRKEIIRGLGSDHPRRQALESLSKRNGHVSAEVGWHSRKMEILLGFGLLGRERGIYAFAAYCQ
ncbi:unnamed protein product [Sympodiomycopsis kandeliae]